MKKLVTFVSIFTIGLGAMAQDAAVNKDLRFGIKASPTISWLKPKSNNLDSDKSSFGFSYGLMADFAIGDNYAFATGLDISHKGGTLTYKDIDNNFKTPVTLSHTDSVVTGGVPYKKTVEYSIQQLEIPLTIKMRTKEIGYLTYYAQVGVAPSITIGAKAKSISYKENITDLTLYSASDVKDYVEAVNNFGISMIIGAGVEYSLSGDTRLVGGITFNNGFTDILDSNDKEYNNDYNEDARPNFLALNIGIFF